MIAGQPRSLFPGADVDTLVAYRDYAVERRNAAAAALDVRVATLRLAQEESLVSLVLIERVRQAAADYAAWHEEVGELDRSIEGATGAGS